MSYTNRRLITGIFVLPSYQHINLFVPLLCPSLSPPPSFRSDLFKYRLVNSKLINSTFLHNKEGCLLSDVSDENNAYMVYFVSFLGTLAVLPGNIVSALLMDKIGRLRMLGNMTDWPHYSAPCVFKKRRMRARGITFCVSSTYKDSPCVRLTS